MSKEITHDTKSNLSFQCNAPKPKSFKAYSYKINLNLPGSLDQVWAILNSRATFSKGQIFPFKVEFLGGVSPKLFDEGEYTNHHGPFLHLPGLISKMEPKKYRELSYFYGSYVLGFRLIRPTLLKMDFVTLSDAKTQVVITLESNAHHFILWLWKLGLHGFWPLFSMGLWLRVWLKSKR